MKARRLRKDYPPGVVAITDNGGRTVDRYTVVYEPVDCTMPGYAPRYWPYTTLSEAPYHPQGFCQHGECPHRPLRHWADKTLSWAEAPACVRNVVRQDLGIVA